MFKDFFNKYKDYASDFDGGYWLAILSAYISIGGPDVIDLNIEVSQNLPEFKDIIKKSINSNNDHTIKLANTCRLEFEKSGDEIYKYMAYLRSLN